MVVFSEGYAKEAFRVPFPKIDASRAKSLAETVLGGPVREAEPLSLDLAVWPDEGVVCVASFAGLDVIFSRALVRSRPSLLAGTISPLAQKGNAYVVFMHSAEDWAAFATWSDGDLVRALSVSPADGIIEDVGDRLSFESPFWNGERQLLHGVDYPLPFHPVDLGNEALREFFGFVLEGREDPFCFDPEEVEILSFRADRYS
ncbi:DUF6928 family protein [Actinoalloteichus sp. GBA129-24]|uniref:DUF6928 family protein n=1 Tax=Actinoalloteichus sp. GBA129-24 TaxID=1612551 RepID=UPI001E60627E|nr:hypothetical protein [Actinoalloteichus sp. GBA129-24]